MNLAKPALRCNTGSGFFIAFFSAFSKRVQTKKSPGLGIPGHKKGLESMSSYNNQNHSKIKTFKTEKGTELPLMNIKGKDYLQVAHRIQWFREDHADWSIETEIVLSEPGSSVFKATIRNNAGQVIATAHKHENKEGFGDHLEKSETGAIGRALAMCGYGTQFSSELEEGERLADAPVTRVSAAPKPVESKPEAINPKIDTTKNVPLTAEEIKYMWAIAKRYGWTSDDVRGYLKTAGIKVEHTSELNKLQLEGLIGKMQKFPKQLEATQ